jgi:hypothetical protein
MTFRWLLLWPLQALAFAASINGALAGERPRMPPMPPSSPQPGETNVDATNDPVVMRCAELQTKMIAGQNSKLRWKIAAIRIAHNPKWGTVWRADTFSLADGHQPAMRWRTVCSKTRTVERPFGVEGLPALTPLQVPGSPPPLQKLKTPTHPTPR